MRNREQEKLKLEIALMIEGFMLRHNATDWVELEQVSQKIIEKVKGDKNVIHT